MPLWPWRGLDQQPPALAPFSSGKGTVWHWERPRGWLSSQFHPSLEVFCSPGPVGWEGCVSVADLACQRGFVVMLSLLGRLLALLVTSEPCKSPSGSAAGWVSSHSPPVLCLGGHGWKRSPTDGWVSSGSNLVPEPFPFPSPAVGISQAGASWPLEKQLPSSRFPMEKLALVGGLPESQEQRDSGAAGGQLRALPASQL